MARYIPSQLNEIHAPCAAARLRS